MFYIRVDANEEIATGHVMRCMAIAKEMRKQGEDCTFIAADRNCEQLINMNGFSMICLDSLWNNLEFETDKIIDIIKLHKIKNLLIDSYYITKEYLNNIRKYTKIIYIDDINKFIYPVDVLINYSGNYEAFQYDKFYNKSSTKLLLGCKYIPLREEFSSIIPRQSDNINKILITTGGTDIYNFSGKFLEYIIANNLYTNIQFHVVAGKFNKNVKSLIRIESNNKNIYIHRNVKLMSKLMLECDLAISAGGSTLYELCACGVPTVCFSFADNQSCGGVQWFAEKGIMKYGGDIRSNESACIESVCDNINIYIKDTNRKKISEKMRQLVDGKGASRIVQNINA